MGRRWESRRTSCTGCVETYSGSLIPSSTSNARSWSLFTDSSTDCLLHDTYGDSATLSDSPHGDMGRPNKLMSYSQYCNVEIGEHRAQRLHLRADAFLRRRNRIHSRRWHRCQMVLLHGSRSGHRVFVFCGFGSRGQLGGVVGVRDLGVEWVHRRGRL